MYRVGVAPDLIVVVCFVLIMFSFTTTTVYAADYQVDALITFKDGLNDPLDSLQTWVNTLNDPCTWFHITCSDNNEVERIDLGNWGLSGPLVPELGSLTKLQYMELFNNNINGSIPKELGNLANLVSLDLYNNTLDGSIPQELGNLKNLRFLRLQDNKLSGPVPNALSNHPNLQVVDISGNPNLCGPLTNPPKACN